MLQACFVLRNACSPRRQVKINEVNFSILRSETTSSSKCALVILAGMFVDILRSKIQAPVQIIRIFSFVS